MSMNKNNTAIKRIMADVRELERHPSSRYHAAPLESNCFEWHFTIRGPSGSDFEGGVYHGRILLPPDYPFKPPNIIFLNKSGRFEVGTKICLSISAYHEETWQPAWGVRTMLEAIISFMPSEGAGAIGALEWSKEERQKAARESLNFCCPACGKVAGLLTEDDPDTPEVPDEAMAQQIAQLKLSKVDSTKAVATPTHGDKLAAGGGGRGGGGSFGGGDTDSAPQSPERYISSSGAATASSKSNGGVFGEEGDDKSMSASATTTTPPAGSNSISSGVIVTSASNLSTAPRGAADSAANTEVPFGSCSNGHTYDDGGDTPIVPHLHLDTSFDQISSSSFHDVPGAGTSGTTATTTSTSSSSALSERRIPPQTPPSVRAVRRQVFAERATHAGGDVHTHTHTHTIDQVHVDGNANANASRSLLVGAVPRTLLTGDEVHVVDHHPAHEAFGTPPATTAATSTAAAVPTTTNAAASTNTTTTTTNIPVSVVTESAVEETAASPSVAEEQDYDPPSDAIDKMLFGLLLLLGSAIVLLAGRRGIRLLLSQIQGGGEGPYSASGNNYANDDEQEL